LELSDTAKREALLREDYDDWWESMYPTYELFVEAVGRAERELRRDRRSPEGPIGHDDPDFVPDQTRTLDDAIDLVRTEIERRPDLYTPYDKPEVDALCIKWSHGKKKSYFANWRRLKSGEPDVIRVNQLLQRPESEVSNEILAALLWHEVVHSMTPGHGHDEVFERLEDRWPSVAELNAQLELIGEPDELD
jgi:hypothetical protein